MLQVFFHDWYVVSFMVSNETFTTICAQGHNVKANCFIVRNNATHYLILFQMNSSIVVDLEKHLSGWNLLVKFPKKLLLLQILYQHCSHYKIRNPTVDGASCFKTFMMFELLSHPTNYPTTQALDSSCSLTLLICAHEVSMVAITRTTNENKWPWKEWQSKCIVGSQK